MRMPVFSEAMAAAFETAQFWKEGRKCHYRDADTFKCFF